MEEQDKGKPSTAPCGATDGPTPVGRTRHVRRAEQEREQGPARTCAPQSARPDQLQPVKAKPVAKEMSSQKGAMALAKRLERYWHDQGFDAARFWAEPVGERFDKIGSYEIYRVASNLVNGLPPRYVDRS